MAWLGRPRTGIGIAGLSASAKGNGRPSRPANAVLLHPKIEREIHGHRRVSVPALCPRACKLLRRFSSRSNPSSARHHMSGAAGLGRPNAPVRTDLHRKLMLISHREGYEKDVGTAVGIGSVRSRKTYILLAFTSLGGSCQAHHASLAQRASSQPARADRR